MDGSFVDDGFIPGAGTFTYSVAVDGGHLYWTSGGYISRATTDGSVVESEFISACCDLQGIAVDTGHIYWAGDDRLGRANLEGSDVTSAFITGTSDARSVAVDAGPLPSATISTPENGATYPQGKSIAASYSCTAPAPATVTDCSGTVPNGAPLDTTTVGSHRFSVRVADSDNVAGTFSVTYYVASSTAPGPVAATGPQLPSLSGIRLAGVRRANPTLTFVLNAARRSRIKSIAIELPTGLR